MPPAALDGQTIKRQRLRYTAASPTAPGAAQLANAWQRLLQRSVTIIVCIPLIVSGDLNGNPVRHGAALRNNNERGLGSAANVNASDVNRISRQIRSWGQASILTPTAAEHMNWWAWHCPTAAAFRRPLRGILTAQFASFPAGYGDTSMM
jgi:hypothetical protein